MYRPYKLNCELIARIVKKNKYIKFKKSDKPDDVIKKSLNWLYTSGPQMIGTMETVINAEEYYWLTHGRKIYFPEDLKLVNNILDSSFRITNAAALYSGEESFILNLPEGFSINGNDKGGGIMVLLMPYNDRSKQVYDKFCKWVGIDNIDVSVPEYGEFLIVAVYQEDPRSSEFMRCLTPSIEAVNILHMKDANEYADYMSKNNQFSYNQGSLLNTKEMQYQFSILRLVCGFLVYKKSLPDRVVSGLPGHSVSQVSTPLTKNMDALTVQSPHAGKEQARAGHYRSWHFRQLISERYYRGEYAHMQPGSRIIFVSDSYVVRDIDAKTVLNK